MGASENELLSGIAGRWMGLAARHPEVLLGPGDDCAVVRGGGTVLLTVDQLVERRHFVSATPVDLIARKAVARGISDIAAMGGVPRWALATGLLPAGYEAGEELCAAIAKWGEHWGCPVVGGDLATGGAGDPLVLTVTVGGEPHRGRGPVTRSGARVGDGVWVTGRLGGTLASGRHLTFEPRVREAGWLCENCGSAGRGADGAGLHAMIDVSDGLGVDAGRIAAASGVRIEIEVERVPTAPGVGGWREAIGGGEDYELCFTAAAEFEGTGWPFEVPLTRIGRVSAGMGCWAVGMGGGVGGGAVEISRVGWEHRT